MFTNTAIKLNSSVQVKKGVVKVAVEERAVCPSVVWCCAVELIVLIEGTFSACRSDVKS